MRMSGLSVVAETHATITDAVILPNKVSVDYVDSDGQGHLEAMSEDHFNFVGTYGYPALDPHCHVEFELYRGHHGNDIMLVGKWWNATTGTKGTWAIKLTRPAA